MQRLLKTHLTSSLIAWLLVGMTPRELPADDGSVQLSEVFVDDFLHDSTDKYASKGDVSWQPGQLILKNHGSVEHDVESGGWVRLIVECDGLCQQFTSASQELRTWILLEDAEDCCVQISRNESSGQTDELAVKIVGTVFDDDGNAEERMHELTLSISDGNRLQIDYRYGLISVSNGPDDTVLAYIECDDSAIRGIRLESIDGAARLDRLYISASAPDETSSEDDSRKLEKAISKHERVSRLSGTGKYDAAIPHATKELRLLRQVLGSAHPLTSVSLSNLAYLHEELHQYQKAADLYRKALEIDRQAYGDGHPLYADTLGDLASALQSSNQYSEAVPLLKKCVEIRRSVFGRNTAEYADALNALAILYHDMLEYSEAQSLYEEVLRIRKEVHGLEHEEYATALGNLGLLLHDQAHYEEAEKLYLQGAAIERRLFGDDDIRSTTTLGHLARLYTDLARYDDAEKRFLQVIEIEERELGRDDPDYAITISDLGGLYLDLGHFVDSRPLLEESRDIIKAAQGTQNLDYSAALNNLGFLYSDMGEFAAAEDAYTEALDIETEILGADHPELAVTLNNLGLLKAELGDNSAALEMLEKSARLTRDSLGEQHPDYATGLNNLAGIVGNMGDYAKARELNEKAIEIARESLGEDHPGYATFLSNYAILLDVMGDQAAANRKLQQVLEICRAVFGEQSIEYADALCNLAGSKPGDRKSEQLEAMYLQALEIRREHQGTHHPSFATNLSNLATLYSNQGRYDEAEQLELQAKQIREVIYGTLHPEFADSLSALAVTFTHKGNFTAARTMYQEALQIRQQLLGAEHSDCAQALFNLAILHYDLGEPQEADEYLARASAIRQSTLEQNAVVQSERHQRGNQSVLRPVLTHRLSNLVTSGQNPQGVVESLWQWKGAVTARQHAYRSAEANPGTAQLFRELQTVSRYLSAMAQRAPLPPAQPATDIEQRAFESNRQHWRGKLAELTVRREQLERQIAGESVEFQHMKEPPTIESVQGWLPHGTAFIDFYQYTHCTPNTQRGYSHKSNERFIVFIVRPDQPVRTVGISSVKEITDLIHIMRRPFSLTSPDPESQLEAVTAAEQLRRLLWNPVEQHLAGVDTVIIAPDTILGTLPFSALPGRRDNTWLLEEYRIATVPNARLLQRVMESEHTTQHRGLLLVGDVDYDASPGADSANVEASQLLALTRSHRGGGTALWQTLPGFSAEQLSVSDAFRTAFGREVPLTTLTGPTATEDAFLSTSGDYQTLHVITHGYFEDPQVPSLSQADGNHQLHHQMLTRDAPVISRYVPGLLSGLAMAGANNPGMDPDDPRDGILRATEIETASMQGVDLVVLSACETGLGAVAGGEGLTGLQRAFQVAGARSVIASLWKVPDRATQELMTRFYTNLWIKKQSKIDALRNAQLDLLRQPVLADGTRLTRSVRPVPKAANDQPDQSPQIKETSDPWFWAAWTLAGDWR